VAKIAYSSQINCKPGGLRASALLTPTIYSPEHCVIPRRDSTEWRWTIIKWRWCLSTAVETNERPRRWHDRTNSVRDRRADIPEERWFWRPVFFFNTCQQGASKQCSPVPHVRKLHASSCSKSQTLLALRSICTHSYIRRSPRFQKIPTVSSFLF
jgi:hypothetical protein